MNDYTRWAIAVVALALVVGLLIWARGDEHHHGTQVGAVPTRSDAMPRKI